MIQLTKLDGQIIAVNPAHLVFAEATPDTVLTLAAGQKLMVKEKVDEVLALIAALSRGSHG